jgi:hypothetical protein
MEMEPTVYASPAGTAPKLGRRMCLRLSGCVLRLINPEPGYSRGTRRSRKALVITETELKLMAAAASMGLSRTPEKG